MCSPVCRQKTSQFSCSAALWWKGMFEARNVLMSLYSVKCFRFREILVYSWGPQYCPIRLITDAQHLQDSRRSSLLYSHCFHNILKSSQTRPHISTVVLKKMQFVIPSVYKVQSRQTITARGFGNHVINVEHWMIRRRW